jgi:hypothetical protein
MKHLSLAGILAAVLFVAVLVSFGKVGTSYPLQAQVAQQQQFTGHENHAISLDKAQLLVKNFRAVAATGAVWGEYFGKDALSSLLSQTGCTGVRIYYGRSDEGKPVLVLVGVDETGRDMTEGLLDEFGWPCPPVCDTLKILGH